MEAIFEAKKARILKQLDTPDEQYLDASPKGSVDERIRELVDEINRSSGFVTTSSCSGRVAVYLEGPKRSSSVVPGAESASQADASAAAASSGGKGGGRWLFTSHAPIAVDAASGNGDVYPLFGVEPLANLSFPVENEVRQYVHLKFEPMILHILCSSIQRAQSALNAATTAGFRESGISSIMDNKGRATPPMVAVRSSGMAFDAIIASQVDGKILPMVSEAYLRTLVGIANDHFTTNEARTARFQQAMTSANATSTDDCEKSASQSQKKPLPERIRRKEARKAETRRAFATAVDREDDICICESEEDDDPRNDLTLLMDSSADMLAVRT